MRKLKLSAQQFDAFVFPYVAQASAANDNEWETALRLIRKLKDEEKTVVAPYSDEEEMLRKMRGEVVFPFRRLRKSHDEFYLEEDEFALLILRLTAQKMNVRAVAAGAFAELLLACENAETMNVKDGRDASAG